MYRLSIVSAAFATAALVAACGHDERPSATAHEVAAAQPVSTPSVTTQVAPAKASSEDSVAISDEIRKACGITDDEAFFPFDSASVVSTSVKALDDVARCFTNGPLAGKRMQLVGHADPRGDVDYNFALSQRRADRVAEYLRNHGVAQKQESTTARGALDATGVDDPTWAKDRRVDILLAH